MPIIYKHPSISARPKLVPGIMKIRQHNPSLCPILIILTIIILSTVSLLLWKNSVQALRINRQTAIAQQLTKIDEVNQQLKAVQLEKSHLIAQNKKLNTQLTMIMETTQVNQKTYEKVLQSLSQSQEKNYDLIKELNFYQRLLTTSSTVLDKKKGITVTDFELSSTEKVNYYTYKLILTQWTKEIKLAEGKIEIYLIGKKRGKTIRLKMEQITDNAIRALTYQFIYFQQLSGHLTLPSKFIPNNLIIRIAPKGQKTANEVSFKWKKLQNK